ncbi:carbohydrate ABC transporter permease [Solirhodobacter olei]|uniref:carbohydrate ABC transporter permease n=1 Tax=Solirhodobacter olei TaxID=2493082 RepID=UPI000FDA51FD|nr:sugar ABC transporter permease [Solirhodobacter olei]
MATFSRNRRDAAAWWLYLMPGLIGFLLVVAVPFAMNIGISFTRWRGIGEPRYVGLANYTRLLADTAFWTSLENTLFFVVAMAVVPTVISLVLASTLFDYVANTFGQGLSSFFRAGFYLPQILPVSAAGILWGWILNPHGVLNLILGGLGMVGLQGNWLGDPGLAIYALMAVMVWLQIGYSLVVFMSGLARVDPSLYEAAELDGAGSVQRFWYITIPMLRPEIFVVGLTTTIAALKVFAPVYVLTNGGPNFSTMVPSYYSYYQFFSTVRVGYGAAIATAQTAITVVLGLIFLWAQSRDEEEDME